MLYLLFLIHVTSVDTRNIALFSAWALEQEAVCCYLILTTM